MMCDLAKYHHIHFKENTNSKINHLLLYNRLYKHMGIHWDQRYVTDQNKTT